MGSQELRREQSLSLVGKKFSKTAHTDNPEVPFLISQIRTRREEKSYGCHIRPISIEMPCMVAAMSLVLFIICALTFYLPRLSRDNTFFMRSNQNKVLDRRWNFTRKIIPLWTIPFNPAYSEPRNPNIEYAYKVYDSIQQAMRDADPNDPYVAPTGNLVTEHLSFFTKPTEKDKAVEKPKKFLLHRQMKHKDSHPDADHLMPFAAAHHQPQAPQDNVKGPKYTKSKLKQIFNNKNPIHAPFRKPSPPFPLPSRQVVQPYVYVPPPEPLAFHRELHMIYIPWHANGTLKRNENDFDRGYYNTLKDRLQYRGWNVTLWTRSMLLNFCREHYPGLWNFVWSRIVHPTQASDFFRTLVMYHFGGLFWQYGSTMLVDIEAYVPPPPKTMTLFVELIIPEEWGINYMAEVS